MSNTYSVQRRGLENSVLLKRGSTVVAEVFTDLEPGDQYDVAALFAGAGALLKSLQSLADEYESFMASRLPSDKAYLAAQLPALVDSRRLIAQFAPSARSSALLAAEDGKAAPGPSLAKPEPVLSAQALNTIGRWMAADMDRAVANGASSVSMPDELVEIAFWLHHNTPTDQPARHDGLLASCIEPALNHERPRA